METFKEEKKRPVRGKRADKPIYVPPCRLQKSVGENDSLSNDVKSVNLPTAGTNPKERKDLTERKADGFQNKSFENNSKNKKNVDVPSRKQHSKDEIFQAKTNEIKEKVSRKSCIDIESTNPSVQIYKDVECKMNALKVTEKQYSTEKKAEGSNKEDSSHSSTHSELKGDLKPHQNTEKMSKETKVDSRSTKPKKTSKRSSKGRSDDRQYQRSHEVQKSRNFYHNDFSSASKNSDPTVASKSIHPTDKLFEGASRKYDDHKVSHEVSFQKGRGRGRCLVFNNNDCAVANRSVNEFSSHRKAVGSKLEHSKKDHKNHSNYKMMNPLVHNISDGRSINSSNVSESNIAKPMDNLTISQRKKNIEEQLGEKIKPVIFINSSDDESGNLIPSKSNNTRIPDQPTPNSAEKVTSSIHYEQNLQNFLRRRSHSTSESKQGDAVACSSPISSTFPTRGILQTSAASTNSPVATKQLFNPSDPSKPFIVPATSRAAIPQVTPSSPKEQACVDEFDDELSLSFDSNSSGGGVGRGFDDILHNIQKGERDIQYYVDSNQIPREFPRMMDIRTHLQNCYMRLFTTNVALCHQKNVESQMWKALYYHIIGK